MTPLSVAAQKGSADIMALFFEKCKKWSGFSSGVEVEEGWHYSVSEENRRRLKVFFYCSLVLLLLSSPFISWFDRRFLLFRWFFIILQIILTANWLNVSFLNNLWKFLRHRLRSPEGYKTEIGPPLRCGLWRKLSATSCYRQRCFEGKLNNITEIQAAEGRMGSKHVPTNLYLKTNFLLHF